MTFEKDGKTKIIGITFEKVINDDITHKWIERRWIKPEDDMINNIGTKPISDNDTFKNKQKIFHRIREIRNKIVHDYFLYLEDDKKIKGLEKEVNNFLKDIDILNLKNLFSKLYYYEPKEWETQDARFIKEIEYYSNNSDNKKIKLFVDQILFQVQVK